MNLVKAPCFDMSKNVFSPIMCLRHLSNQGNTGLLLNLDLFEKKKPYVVKKHQNPRRIKSSIQWQACLTRVTSST